MNCTISCAQNPLLTFPRNFPVDGDDDDELVADLLSTHTANYHDMMSLTSPQQVCSCVVVMEFGKRPDTTDTTPRTFARANLLQTCCRHATVAMGKLV